MDKYFAESYDPRLDVAPLAPPSVPATGLIDNSEYAGWDAMLDLIRVRREDKEDKRRLERLGIGKDTLKKDRTKSGEGEKELGLMDIKYSKTREWDIGKAGFD